MTPFITVTNRYAGGFPEQGRCECGRPVHRRPTDGIGTPVDDGSAGRVALMSEVYDWTWLRTVPEIDMETYLAMPTDLSRTIEVKDGFPVVRGSRSTNHVAVTSAIEQAMRDAVRKLGPHESRLRASREVDMLVSEVPFNFRTPDVIAYRCIEEPRGRWKTKPTAVDAVLVVEVVSPGTVTADCIDKRAEYARLGIEQYWIVRM